MILKRIQKAPNEIVPFDDPRIRYPMYGSQKFDGFRCLTDGESFLTSVLKPFANTNLARHFVEFCEFLKDCHLIVDAELWSPTLPFAGSACEGLNGSLTNRCAPIDASIGLYVFDMHFSESWDRGIFPPFSSRYEQYLSSIVHSSLGKSIYPHIFAVEQRLLSSPQEAQDFYDAHISAGHEGIMLRSPRLGYKHGRSTHNESWLYKFKHFETVDAVIVDVIRQNRLRAGVAREYDVQGLLERPHAQGFYEPDNKIAGFVVEYNGITVGVKAGKGFTNYDKEKWFTMWEVDSTFFRGKHVEFSYMPHGTKDKPRIGSLVRFRPDLD